MSNLLQTAVSPRSQPTPVAANRISPPVPHAVSASGEPISGSEEPVSGSTRTALLRVEHLGKSYRKGPIEIPVLRGVDMRIHRGEFLAIVGQSGSGKSTLLHVVATLDAPDHGTVHFHDRRIDNLPACDRDRLRNRYLGMIFQFYHLLPELSTLENVMTPLMIGRSTWGFFKRRRALRARAEQILEMVGLAHRLKHKPRELSGGEMQRAAIARALIAGPELLLADEPTGNLDHATGQAIMDILRSLNRHENLTIVMVTHDGAIAEQADRVVRLINGRIEGV
jgi:lipoprotein-releasing system ATP-binding protein